MSHKKTYRIVFDMKSSKYWAEFLSDELPEKRFPFKEDEKDVYRESGIKKTSF